MTASKFFLGCAMVHVLSAGVLAHGPQIQITNTNDAIVTRRLLLDGPYSTSLSAPTTVYVMPVEAFGGVSYSRPNDAIDPITLLPAFPSGPGLAYGYDLADGGPQLFQAGSVFSVGFTQGLKLWDGASFVNAGATELKAFRGSNAGISAPPENFAVTSDSGPFDSVSLAAVAGTYGTEDEEVHSSLRWALLGDGMSPTSAAPDGVYLVSLQISSSQVGLAASDEYFFVLHKNPAPGAVAAAVGSLGFGPDLVQAVPEPSALLLAAFASVGVLGRRVRQRSQQPGRTT